MRGLERRVAGVAARLAPPPAPSVPPILVVSPGAWPAADEAAYRAAVGAGDQERVDGLIERHTGHRPARGTRGQIVVVIAERPDGPR